MHIEKGAVSEGSELMPDSRPCDTAECGQEDSAFVWRLFSIWTFHGRISRRTFWIESVVTLVLGLVGEYFTGPLVYDSRAASNTPFVLFLPFLALAWISTAATVKRWHDLDHSGWMALLNLAVIPIPFTLISTYFFKGTKGQNRFGPDPIADRKQSYLQGRG